MLTVRNMRPKPELKSDKSMMWVAGFVVLALVMWSVRATVFDSSVPVETKPVSEKPIVK
jgi:hypothetical protein